MNEQAKWDLLRHTLATLAYRAEKAVRGVPPEFASFQLGPTSRNPGQILAHIGDLLDWSLWLLQGKHIWHDSPPLPWEEEKARLFDLLRRLDHALSCVDQTQCDPERLFQGPVADALTHVGQLTMLRRLAGRPVRGENYFKAEIVAGRVGTDQPGKRVEFD